MRHIAHLVLSVSLVTLAAGCEKPSNASPEKSSSAAKEEKKEEKGATKEKEKAPEAPKVTKIEKVGLSVELPPESTVSDGIGDKSAMVSTGNCTLTVSVAKDTDPKTSADGKGGALATENMKIEKLSDGWYITSENTGSAGRNYWLTMRREIGGKGYMCETLQSSADQVKCAIAICKGLK